MELEELKNELMNIDINDCNGLLKLLVQAYYYNDILIESGFYKELYKRLKDTYKPLTEDKEGLLLYRDLKDKKKNLTVDNYSLVMLEQLMIFIKGNLGIDVAIVEKLFEYHNRVNKDFIKDLYTSKIKENIGNKVVAIVDNNNHQAIESGRLSYDGGVTIDDKKMNNNVYKIQAGKKIVYYYQNNKVNKNKKRKKAKAA